MSALAIALNRFGLGATPGSALPDDPKRWLLDQFDRFEPKSAAIAAAPSRAQIAGQLADYLEQNRDFIRAAGGNGPRRSAAPSAAPSAMTMTMKPGEDAPASADQTAQRELRKFIGQTSRRNYVALVGARVQTAVGSDTPFIERMVAFWANHFAVSADKLTTIGLAGTLEFDAIRPHVLGRFSDMVSAVERHPAMLLYLDQAQSIGPNSVAGQRIAARGRRKVGLNENLAREIMELHTLGVRTGYSQADVTEFARAMTGWSVSGISRGPLARLAGLDGEAGQFRFVALAHEPGARTIMGRRYAQEGEAQASAIIADLCAHPATAQHIATKLARHFTGDNPPPALIDRLRANFVATNGDLAALYRTLIKSPELWVATPLKFRSPWDWTIAAMRAVQLRDAPPPMAVGLLTQLGQPVWRPGSPAGFEDLDATWAGPDALMRRVEVAERIAARAPATGDPRALAAALYPGGLSPATTAALAQADSPQQALALLLVSPEAMRR